MLTPPFDPARPDLCVIGAGVAGHAIALAAAALGMRCTVVDRRATLGAGQAADLLDLVAAEAAARLPAGSVGDWALLARTAGIALARAAPDHAAARLRTLGIAVVIDAPRFSDPRTLLAGGLVIRARRFVVATGSVEDGEATGVPAVTPAGLLREPPPAHATVVAERPAGLVWAQVLARHGIAVTLVVTPGAFGEAHPEVAAFARAGLERDGVAIIAVADGAAALREATRHAGPCLRFAPGQPATAGLDLGRAGIALDGRGHPVVDGRFRTANPRVFAVGDVLGRVEGGIPGAVAVVLRAVASGLPAPSPSPVVTVLRTVPPVAQVGTLSAGRLWRAPAAPGSLAGPVLAVLATNARGRVVGAGLAGAGAADAIAAAALAVGERLSPAALAGVVGAGPAADALRRAALAAVADRLRTPSVRRLIGLVQKLP